MWVFTENGFYSVVAYSADKARWGKLPEYPDPENYLVVRCRVKKDAEYAAQVIGDAYPNLGEVEVFDIGGDYPYRIVVPREAWRFFLDEAVEDLDYTNFKNRVTKKQGFARHDVYMRVWSALISLEPRRAWSTWSGAKSKEDTGPKSGGYENPPPGLDQWLKNQAVRAFGDTVSWRYNGLVFYCNAGHPIQMHSIERYSDILKWQQHIADGGGNTVKRSKSRKRRRRSSR